MTCETGFPIPVGQPRAPTAPSPSTVRAGIVPYLNVQPLIWSLRPEIRAGRPDDNKLQVSLEPEAPSLLASRLHDGLYDVAIVPIFEYFRHPIYTIVRNVAIGCRGPVRSVVLFSDTPLQEVEVVRLDPASLTSTNLIRVLMGEMGYCPQFRAPADPDAIRHPGRREARLIIGDPAIAARNSCRYEYDLGQLWFEMTGYPFIFAAWLISPQAPFDQISRLLQDAAVWGMENLATVAAGAGPRFGMSAQDAFVYFRDSISYDFGDEEARGVMEYQRLCRKYGLIGADPVPLRFV